MVQLCRGQATRVPNTMPWLRGPPRWGQRSSSAKMPPSALRNSATSSPRGRATRRAPSSGMSSMRQMACQSGMRSVMGQGPSGAGSGVQRGKLACVQRRLVELDPGVGLIGQRTLQSFPQRLAPGRVLENALFHMLQAHAAHVVHAALLVTAFLAGELAERSGVFQRLVGGLELGEEIRLLGLNAPVAGGVHLPAPAPAPDAHVLDA